MTCGNCGGFFDIEGKLQTIGKLEQELAQPGFWDDRVRAVSTTQKLERLTSEVEKLQNLRQRIQDLEELSTLTPETDEASWNEMLQQCGSLQKEFAEYELSYQLSGPYDHFGAILTLHAGAGGVDAQDWTRMLFRMYVRYAEQKGWKCRVIEEAIGQEAGIKRVMVEIQGDPAYGFLKAESGVHRLVRISPFDAEKMRHTSFALCEVIPLLSADSDIEIRDEDIEVDTFRSSGHGGQSVNTTDSAVRIRHQPTGIVVTCQNERSQRQNREFALSMLKAKIAHQKEQERVAHERALRGEHHSAEWGAQIRSYVLHPYQLVKDHRTGVERNDPDAVLEGDLDPFVTAWLSRKER
ncbi:MAG: peptide chain release factor 2 [Candidatus Kerfeldbacteria bacterium]|nr:peptide chain release factor 2 [Candidatus Kerfeldbacteria bacterium]